MLPNKEKLKEELDRFNGIYGTDFSYERFEEKAEQYNAEQPGNGFRLAYQDALAGMYKQMIENLVDNGVFKSKASSLVSNFDALVINPYINECDEQGEEIDIRRNAMGIVKLSTLTTLKKVLDENPTTKAGMAQRRFEKGELTFESALAFSRSKSEGNLDKKDALTIASYAKGLEMRTKNRSFREMLRHPIDHIREKLAARAMRKIAAKCGEKIENLIEAVTTEDDRISKDYSEINGYWSRAEMLDKSERNRIEIEKDVIDVFSNPKISSSKVSDRIIDNSNNKTYQHYKK